MIAKKDDLLSCYKNKTKKTLEIFDAIKDAQRVGVLSKCPYCGITRPGTFDHYLPEAEYPEFSVHALNLVPCCSDCNSSKGPRFKTGNQRHYLHYYSDPFPEDQFLFVDIVTRPNVHSYGVRFYIQIPHGFSLSSWRLIENHFKKLKLLQRYKDEANDEVMTAFSACKNHLKDGGANVANFLNGVCDDEEDKFGNSHWRIVLKRKLITMPDFINHVTAEANRP